MNKIYTHYDNLKVARNAPEEVIRAAYKILSQKYHPDKNSSDPDSARIMSIINNSYEVLSDPQKRRAHDLWIVEMEGKNYNEASSNQPPPVVENSIVKKPNPIVKFIKGLGEAAYYYLRAIVSYAIGMSVVIGALWLIGQGIELISGHENSTAPASNTYHSNPSQVKQKYTRPNLAPNGSPWPSQANYVAGYEKLEDAGLSSVTVDNSQNDSDVFVKLVKNSVNESYPIRAFYIPAHGKFKVTNVNQGKYDIRYKDLDSGGLSKSESFMLEEIKTYNGVNFSEITMTLYKVRNGNMQTYGINESEF